MEDIAARSQMMIRKPVAEVFQSIIDPSITNRFWFSKGSDRLVVGKRVRWDWEMYGHHTDVDVKAIEENERILIEWNIPDNPSLVEWTFEPKGADQTMVNVKNWDFRSDDPDKVIAEALDSTGGFTFLLAAMKVFLEHGIEPNIVVDHAPDSLVGPWATEK
jgi:uncharacterized protein YndB with AHSA1/START domain